jgi:hypothetical protein
MSTFDPFALDDSTGGDYSDEYTGTITSVEFKIGQFGDLEAEVYTTYDEPRAKNDGTLSIGRPEFIKIAGRDQGWTTDGQTFTHPDGKKPRANSAWGKFVTRLQELGATSIVGNRVKWDREGEGAPYDMPVEDDSITWMTKKVRAGEGWVEKGGKGGPRSDDDPQIGDHFHGKAAGKMIPVELLGSSGASNGHAFDLGPLREAGLTPVMESYLVKEAKVSNNAGDFLARAVTVAGVNDCKPVVGALADPGFYEALKAQ